MDKARNYTHCLLLIYSSRSCSNSRVTCEWLTTVSVWCNTDLKVSVQFQTPLQNTNFSSTRNRELQSCNLTMKIFKYGIFWLLSHGHEWKKHPQMVLDTSKKKKKKEIYSAYSRAGEQGQTVDIEEDPAYRFSNGVPAVRWREFKPLNFWRDYFPTKMQERNRVWTRKLCLLFYASIWTELRRNGFLWACGKVVLYALFVISALYPCVISHPSLTKAFVSVWLHSGRWRFFSSFALAGLPDPGQSRPPWKSTEVRYHYYQFHLVCIRLLVNSFSRKFYNHRLIRRGSLKASYCNACSQMARSCQVASGGVQLHLKHL